MKTIKIASSLLIIVVLATGLYAVVRSKKVLPPAVVPQPLQNVSALPADFKALLANYRKIIVLMADEKKMSKPELAASVQVGQEIFHANAEQVGKLDQSLDALVSSSDPTRLETISGLLDYVEADKTLFDADRLAFREILQSLQDSITKDTSLNAIKMHKRIS